jgi:alanyl-tRNA synthetase
MTSSEIRERFLAFFKKRNHKIIPSSPLLPENDPSVLFNTAGMQPLVPYLMGEPHPTGSKRLANSQKCVRTNDIDEVGDKTHLTFFEMLGNWSLGDYFKKDAIMWSYEFLTSKEEGLGLLPKRLYVTVFEGDDNAPRDDEAYGIWRDIFQSEGLDPEKRIFFRGAEDNWWSPGDNGPCGPDSEMFYDISGTLTEGMTLEEFIEADDKQDIVEIWNDVFMEYMKKDGKVVGKLESKNVDTGSGLERVVAIVQEKDTMFETDLFAGLVSEASKLTDEENNKRIISDHMRAAVFLIADGAMPSNTDQGYVLRRLIRRAVLKTEERNISRENIQSFVDIVVEVYGGAYANLKERKEHIFETISKEVAQFGATLKKGLRQFEKHADSNITGKEAFTLFTTHGFPIELTEELAHEKGIEVDVEGFKREMKEHQEKSRVGAEQKFKGGLADDSVKTTMLHTATHLMLAGLRKFLGEDVHQAGSNITEERTRFDFTHGEKVDRATLDKVEQYVNDAIAAEAEVFIEKMQKDDAKAAGVEGSFWEKYPDTVNVYMIKDNNGVVWSQELCGGPHVKNTGTIKGHFKIGKEKASSAGVRRVKATLE